MLSRFFQKSSLFISSTNYFLVRKMSSNQKLVGKVAVVTASTEGIGFAIAKRLAIDGASVVVSSRKKNNVDQAVEKIKSISDNVAGITCHVGKAEDRQRLLDFTVSKYGGIDILVSNAAVNPVMCQILDTPEEAWDKIFDVNVKATFLLTQQVVPLMEKRGGGSIVYVSSIAAFKPMEVIGAYSVSKTTLLGLTKAVASQCVSSNIRVNCLCPGIIETKFSESLTATESARELLNQVIPMRRIGKPDECAGMVSFLCSEDASYITGEAFPVAGGTLMDELQDTITQCLNAYLPTVDAGDRNSSRIHNGHPISWEEGEAIFTFGFLLTFSKEFLNAQWVK